MGDSPSTAAGVTSRRAAHHRRHAGGPGNGPFEGGAGATPARRVEGVPPWRVAQARAGSMHPLADGGLALARRLGPEQRSGADGALVEALRAGDDTTFAALVDGWSASMRRAARAHVATDSSAEEVVQDTWLAVLK